MLIVRFLFLLYTIFQIFFVKKQVFTLVSILLMNNKYITSRYLIIGYAVTPIKSGPVWTVKAGEIPPSNIVSILLSLFEISSLI